MLIGLLAITSLLYVRRLAFELFLKMHAILALALNGTLWVHFPLSQRFSVVCLGLASAIWVLDQSLKLARQLRQAFGVSRNEASMTVMDDATLLQVNVQHPWQVRHGQYVYLSVSNVPHSVIGRLQSHPYLIAWADGDCKTPSQNITCLIASRRGFSNALRLCKTPTSIRMDGPFGRTDDLSHFDKALLISSGIGIASQLLAVRQLLQQHDQRSARIRRVTLLWFLESESKLLDSNENSAC